MTPTFQFNAFETFEMERKWGTCTFAKRNCSCWCHVFPNNSGRSWDLLKALTRDDPPVDSSLIAHFFRNQLRMYFPRGNFSTSQVFSITSWCPLRRSEPHNLHFITLGLTLRSAILFSRVLFWTPWPDFPHPLVGRVFLLFSVIRKSEKTVSWASRKGL